jgi:hypothetical protein
MLIAEIEFPQNIEGGDHYFRSYARVCMALEEGVYVFNLTGEHRVREEIADQAGKMILMNPRAPKIYRKFNLFLGQPNNREIA